MKTESILLRVFRCLLLKSVFAFCLLPCAFPAPASAQSPPQTENRFLFIINTSSAMRRLTNGIQQAVLGLLQSGMQEQMRDGDTFGIWTYDDQLHTGFPMQAWSNQNQGAIIQTVSAWLAQTRYQNRPRLDKVLPAARQVIAQSRAVTLIFIFDGSETMQGTGFDKDINDLHKEFGREVRAENIPFVTVLAARDGRVFDYRVRTPSSASVPRTADLFKPVETNSIPDVAATNPPPSAVVASKPPEPRHVEIVLKPTPSPQPAPSLQTNPPPVTTSTLVPQSAPAIPEPIIQPAPRPGAEEPPPQSPNPNPNLSPNLNPNHNLNPTTALPEPPPPSVNTIGRAPDKSGLPAASPASLAPPLKPAGMADGMNGMNGMNGIQPAPANTAGRSPDKSGLPAAPPEPLPPPFNPVAMTPANPASNPQSAIRNPQSSSALPAPPPHPAPLAVPPAVAIPSSSDHLALLVIAISLVTIAVVLVLFLMRRSRAAPSLISQSMDRPE